jgi:drug/metabolite transporter (DMT)-like permease
MSHQSSSAAAASRWSGVLLIAISAAAFGTLAIFARLAYASGADPMTVLLLRFTLAGAVLVGLMLARGARWPRGRVLLGLALMGGAGYIGQSMAYFFALTAASAGLVALLLYLYPALVTLLSVLALGERLTPVKLGAIVVALAGTALTIGPAQGGRPLGIALALAAALIYSVYIVVGSRILPHAGPLPATAVIITSAGVVCTGIVGVRGAHLPQTPLGWIAVVAIALISTVVAVLTFFAGLARVGPSSAATLSTLEPAVTVTLAALVLHETIGPLQLAGGALILAAVVTLARAAR